MAKKKYKKPVSLVRTKQGIKLRQHKIGIKSGGKRRKK